MSKRCQNRGCKKLARHPSCFCNFHAVLEARVVPSRRRPKKPQALCRKRKTVAYCQKHSLSHFNHQPCLEAIQSAISDLSPSTDPLLTVGVRRLLPINSAVLEKILPLLLSVVALATKVVAFPLKNPVVHAPNLVVAPPSSSHSNAWSKGPLHRDSDSIETSGVYSFLLYLDEVTRQNGPVVIWRHSKSIGIDPRHPERALDQACLSSELSLGTEGTVDAWDARLLHRSLANRTQKTRLALQWMVTSGCRNGVQLTVFN